HELSHETALPRAELALDEYLGRRLAALIEDAARQGKAWVLDTLITFRRELADEVAGHGGNAPPPPPPYLERTMYDEGPAGMQLYGRTLDAATRFGLPEVGERAVGQIGQYAH